MTDIFPNIEEDSPRAVEVVPPSALESMERASIDVQVRTAKAFPRGNPKAIQGRIMSIATMDEETAQACFYTLKRDGKLIQGPSVRLAEIAISQWGNLRAAARVVDNDGRFITAMGLVHDLETNVAVSVEVKRRITTKEGRTYSDDMQTTAANAANSIAYRNAAFKVIPRAVFAPVYERCREVAIGKAKPVEQLRGEALEAFAKMGVSAEQILAYFELETIEQIGVEQISDLMGVRRALRDGETTIAEEFPSQPAKAKTPKAAPKNDSMQSVGDALKQSSAPAVDAEKAEALAQPINGEQRAALFSAAAGDETIIIEAARAAGYETIGDIKQRDYTSLLAKVVEAAKKAKGGAKK